MCRLVRETVKFFCPFLPIDIETLTVNETVPFAGATIIPNQIYEVDRGRLPVTIAGSITNTSLAPITVIFTRRFGVVTNIIPAGSSLSFVHNNVAGIRIIGTGVPYAGLLEYQATYRILV